MSHVALTSDWTLSRKFIHIVHSDSTLRKRDLAGVEHSPNLTAALLFKILLFVIKNPPRRLACFKHVVPHCSAILRFLSMSREAVNEFTLPHFNLHILCYFCLTDSNSLYLTFGYDCLANLKNLKWATSGTQMQTKAKFFFKQTWVSIYKHRLNRTVNTTIIRHMGL